MSNKKVNIQNGVAYCAECGTCLPWGPPCVNFDCNLYGPPGTNIKEKKNQNKESKESKEFKNTKSKYPLKEYINSKYRLKEHDIPERRTYIGNRYTDENNPYNNNAYLELQQKMEEFQKKGGKEKQYEDYEKYKNETNQYLKDSQWVQTPNRKLYSIIWGIIFYLAGAFLDVNGWHIAAWIFFAMTGMSVLTFFYSPK